MEDLKDHPEPNSRDGSEIGPAGDDVKGKLDEVTQMEQMKLMGEQMDEAAGQALSDGMQHQGIEGPLHGKDADKTGQVVEEIEHLLEEKEKCGEEPEESRKGETLVDRIELHVEQHDGDGQVQQQTPETQQHTYNVLTPPPNEIQTKKKKRLVYNEIDEQKSDTFNEFSSARMECHEPKNIEQSDLEIIRWLGEGNFGITFTAKWNSVDVVVKAPKHGFSKQDKEELKTFLRLPPCSNVLSIIGVCHNFVYKRRIEAPTQAIVVPFQANGDLKKFMQKHGRLGEQQTVSIVLGMARGVAHLHENNLIHRDLALRNYLVSLEGRILVADFGLTRSLEDSHANSAYYKLSGGEVPWRIASPEMLKTKKCNKSSDVWAFGIAIWELFHPTMMPFPEIPSVPALCFLFVGKNFLFSLDYGDTKEERYPDIFKTIAGWCCVMDPLKRCSIHEVIQLLERSNVESNELEAKWQCPVEETDAQELDIDESLLDGSKSDTTSIDGLEEATTATPESKELQEAKILIRELTEQLKLCVENNNFLEAQELQDVLAAVENRVQELSEIEGLSPPRDGSQLQSDDKVLNAHDGHQPDILLDTVSEHSWELIDNMSAKSLPPRASEPIIKKHNTDDYKSDSYDADGANDSSSVNTQLQIGYSIPNRARPDKPSRMHSQYGRNDSIYKRSGHSSEPIPQATELGKTWRLMVHVKNAKNLGSKLFRSKGSKRNPYCRICPVDIKKVQLPKRQTRCIKQSSHPEWNELFSWMWSCPLGSVVCEVWNYNNKSAEHLFMGRCIVKFGDGESTFKLEDELRLLPKSGRKDNAKGNLHVKINYSLRSDYD